MQIEVAVYGLEIMTKTIWLDFEFISWLQELIRFFICIKTSNTEYDAVRKQFKVCQVYPTAWNDKSVIPPATAEIICTNISMTQVFKGQYIITLNQENFTNKFGSYQVNQTISK
jgi:hypothetical protein